MNNDLISREALKKAIEKLIGYSLSYEAILNAIDNAPTVTPSLNLNNITEEDIKKFKTILQRAHSKCLLAINEERPQGECKTCKYYHPFCEQFTNKPRGDGYCVIARMTAEGMTTINCKDEFGCSDYQKGGAE